MTPPATGTKRMTRPSALPPTVVSSRKPTALLTIIAAALGSRDVASRASRPEPVRPAAVETPALCMSGVRADQGEQHGGPRGLVGHVIPPLLGDRRDHAGGEGVELQHVDRDRHRHREDATDTGEEATDRGLLDVLGDDLVDDLVAVAAVLLADPGQRLAGGLQRPDAVHPEVEQLADEGVRHRVQRAVLLGLRVVRGHYLGLASSHVISSRLGVIALRLILTRGALGCAV